MQRFLGLLCSLPVLTENILASLSPLCLPHIRELLSDILGVPFYIPAQEYLRPYGPEPLIDSSDLILVSRLAVELFPFRQHWFRQ